MKKMLAAFLVMFLTAAVLAVDAAAADSAKPAQRPNVLFIAIDDLNHWIGYLGRNGQTRTPNLDALANRCVAFTHSYCAAPACNPSRVALMSGRAPSSTGIYDNSDPWRAHIDPATTLTTQFLNAGYNVYGAGKIYHGSAHRDEEWTDYFDQSGGGNMQRDPSAKDNGVGGIAFAPLANEDADMPDYKVVSYGIEHLNKKQDKPFFLAIGLVKPHMPWSVPKKYYDQFPLDKIELPPHREGDLADIPAAGVKMAGPNGDHARMLESGRWKEAVQAYLATISFCDGQVGRLIEALDNSKYKDNTIVVLWCDHGWHLGEKEHWRKFALWEEATRAPMMWMVPGLTKAGQCERTVDFLSIYPTLCDLTGLPIPDHAQGPSLRPLLENPAAEWDRPALTTFRLGNHALRTEEWRYIRYEDGSEELYNEVSDPYEWTNLAGDKNYAATKAELARWLPKENHPTVPAGPEGDKNNKKKAKKKQQAKGE